MRAAPRVHDDYVSLPGTRLDRRLHVRGTTASEPDRRFLTSMILGTYREMPGLTLHVNQAARLFGLPISTCRIVLDDLVHARQLRRAADGQYTGT